MTTLFPVAKPLSAWRLILTVLTQAHERASRIIRQRGADRDTWKLVKRAQRGDTDASDQLYREYIRLVFRVVYGMVGNRDAAEDLTSETFLRALSRIGTVRQQGKDVGAWLTTIARNLATDHLRSAQVRREIATGDLLNCTVDGPEEELLHQERRQERREVALAALRKLTEDQRQCLMLRLSLGLTHEEVAEAMGKTVPATRQLQRRAMLAFTRFLAAGTA